jgi:hypothetical protein
MMARRVKRGSPAILDFQSDEKERGIKNSL